jgi:hypothetical protein
MAEPPLIPCRQRTRRKTTPVPYEVAVVQVRSWHPTTTDPTAGILLQQGRRQWRFTLADAYELADAITDTAETIEAEYTITEHE